MTRIDRRRVLLVLTTVLFLLVGLLTGSAQAQPTLYPGPWSITMVSEGEFIGQGVERVFDDANATLHVGSSYESVNLRADGGPYGEYFEFRFQAPSQKVLTPGWYAGAQRFGSSARPSMDIDGEHRGCNKVAGDFEVRDIAWSSTGTLDRLWLIYEQHCEGGDAALFGEIRLGVPADQTDVEPDVVRWPDLDTGAQSEMVPVTVRQTGTSNLGISTATLAGAHPQNFTIRSDGCSGRTLVEGDTCVVSVRFTPRTAGPRSAVLRLTTDSTTIEVGLDGYGMPGITDWQMTSDTGDWVGQGNTYHYSSTADAIAFGGTTQYLDGAAYGANDDLWRARFVPAAGDIFAEGETYQDARNYPFNGSAPGMDVSGNGRGCNDVLGSFTVHQIGFSPATGALDRLDLSFEQHCEAATPALRGRLRYHARADVTPPARATEVAATRATDTTAHVSWTNPADGDYAGTVVRYLSGARAPGQSTVGHLAYSGMGTATTISGLRPGRAYTFAVFTYDTTGNVSRARVVTTQGSAQQTLTAAPTTITYGSGVTFEGRLNDLDGVPLAGHTIRLQSRPAGATTWSTASTLTTSSPTGDVSTSVKPSTNREYRFLSDATSAFAAAASPTALITVRQKVTATVNDNSIALGQTATIKGSVSPSHAGKPVYLQRYYSGAWQTIKTATLTSTSTYSVTYRPTSAGTRTLRVYRPADADHASGTSPTMKLTVS